MFKSRQNAISFRGMRICLSLWMGLALLIQGSHCLRADLILTNYSSAKRLKIMPSGDSITDDCSINGAYRLYLQPLLETNGYAFTNVGRFISGATASFNKTKHEGICGAVIAYPGMFSYYGYATASNYAQRTLSDALTNNSPDLFLIDLGVNDMGYGRNPFLVASNHMAALLNMIFTKLPSANIIVAKPTTITRASIGSPSYSYYSNNMITFCSALQTLVNQRRAQGQNVFIADLFSAVNGITMMQGDGTHPNAAGVSAMAQEFNFRIAAMTVRPDRLVTPFISGGSTWRYSDQGLDLGTNWSQLNYDDAGWTGGLARMGYNTPGLITTVSYGPDASNKRITTYFRKTFVVPNNARYTNLNVRLNRACGAAVWLNGKEMYRVNLPSGPVSSLTLATAPVTGDSAATYYPSNIALASLPPGTNLIGVEIHQFSPSNAVQTFDMELFGLGEYLPQLTAAQNATNFSVTWPATNHAGFVLVSGTDLDQLDTWAPLGGPYTFHDGIFEYREPIIFSQTGNYYALRFSGVSSPGPNLGWDFSSNSLHFYWPTNFAGFNLETSTNLPPGATWQTIKGPYIRHDSSFETSVPRSTGSQQYYRLRKLTP